jgi:outer membrane protein assembly factor BamB
VDGLVIVTTNARTIVAYDALSGKLAWRQKLDGSSGFGPLFHRNAILAVSDSLYLLNPTIGKVQQHFSWKEEEVYQAESTPRSIILTFWPKDLPSNIEQPGKTGPERMTTLITKSGLQRTTKFNAFCASFRYSPATRLVYLSHMHGIDLVHPEKGTVLCELKTTEDTGNGIALVDVRDKKIYALTGDGKVYALRHPAGFP